jgi:SAM-dependent methyltransferase
VSTPGDDVLALMRNDWDRRAAEDARFYIASGAAGSDAEFRASGRRDVEDAVLDGIRLSPSAGALEIGCGVGRLLVPLAPRVARAYGVDISPAMIEASKGFTAGAPNVTTWVTDGLLAPVEDASLDFVFSYIVFQHIPDRAPVRRYVEEAARVLKPGGLFRFQVDGRWKRAAAGAATTYDGVKFSPADVRALLAGTGLVAVEEWGEETHYHWVTARRAGEALAGVSFRARAWDRVAVEEAISRCGSGDAVSDADRVVSGAESLRRALAGAEAAISLESHGDFVRDAFERVFGRGPDPGPLEALVRLLETKTEVRKDLVDILLAAAEARDLFRPRPVPWPRLASLGLPDRADFAAAVAAAERLLAGESAGAVVDRAFHAILGSRPDAEARACYGRVAEAGVAGRRRLARALLGARDADPPKPPSIGRRGELLLRHGVEAGGEPLAGESFAGESAVGRRILATSADASDAAFLRNAYLGVLGREPDADGAAWYRGRLAGGSLNRATLLRELLWSEELRRD